MYEQSLLAAPVLPNDTVGLFCQRHALTRDEFFALNPGKPVLFTTEGVPTAELDEGELLAVQADPTGEPSAATQAVQERAARCIKLGGIYSSSTNGCCQADDVKNGKCIGPDLIEVDDMRQKNEQANEGANQRLVVGGLLAAAAATIGGVIWWNSKHPSAA